jgi:hypothetical protein
VSIPCHFVAVKYVRLALKKKNFFQIQEEVFLSQGNIPGGTLYGLGYVFPREAKKHVVSGGA